MHYRVDDSGQIVVDSNGLFNLWLHGGNLDGADIIADDEIAIYNEQCIKHSKNEFLIPLEKRTPLSHRERSANWLIPEVFKTLDVEEFCLDLCQTDDQRDRVRNEMVLFRERNLVPMLQALMYLVDTLRTNRVLWGVGRGSSVASYVLYLIGVHRIDSLKHQLQIEEFLRD